ncbi:histidine phosphatase family protein [Micrococcus sp. EYE_162]|uniref:histidine phosphatase family protein n=1 Tax=unclassified Micrococcus TaxID=2620948 RepID=UPI002006B20E|nr:histidine phosphatase family protein [Micrococcus sp. EYE_212]MCK6170446.1 histidine phosphatase family protein [Micrococcus sp. EYE_162]
MRLILLRHGETDWNALDRYQGRTDVDLNAVGERQARSAAAGAVGDLLQDADELIAVSSPLSRAQRTARIVLEAAVGAVDLALDAELMELHGGEWEGLELSAIAERWPAEHEAWRRVPSLDAGPVGGEVLRDGGARVLRAVAAHVPASWTTGTAGGRGAGPAAGPADDPTRTVLVVAHGAVLRSAVGQLLGLEGDRFAALARLENARAAVLEGSFDGGGVHDPAGTARTTGDGAWELLGYNV